MPDLPAGQPAEDDADDIGADLSAAYDALEGGAETPPQQDEGTESASAPASTSSVSSPTEAGAESGRPRGPDGRFTKAELAAQAAAQAAQQPTEFKIPEKWPAPVREKLAAIHAANPEHAQFLLDQYNFMRSEAGQALARAQQERAAHLKTYEDLLSPGRQQRALAGIDDSTYVRNLIAAGDVLDKNPEQGLRWLAQKYGVDLQNLANPQAGSQQPEIPEWARGVVEKQNAIERFIAQQASQQEKQHVERAVTWVNQFAEQRDANGQPLYPHFDLVIEEMMAVIDYQMRTNQPVDVKAAYDKAVWMNDSVRHKEQVARSEAARKEAEARQKRELVEAKRAGFSVSGSGADTSETIPDDIGEHLARNYERFVRS